MLFRYVLKKEGMRANRKRHRVGVRLSDDTDTSKT